MRLSVIACLIAGAFAVTPTTSAEKGVDESAGMADTVEQPAVPTQVSIPPSEASLDAPVLRSEYIVGPYDVFSLNLWGEVNTRTRLVVTPEGDLILPVGGTVRVAGSSIESASQLVAAKLGEFYHETEITLSLVVPRKLIVHVTGAVVDPGDYDVTAATRVSTLIKLAGGLMMSGSERNIILKGSDGQNRRVDLVRYRNLGDLESNPLVMEGSVVHVPFEEQTATILGAVYRPGIYEVVAGDRLIDMLDLAGGPLPQANLRDIEVVRFSREDPKRYTSSTVDLTVGLGGPVYPDVAIRDGDRIFVREIESWHRDSRVEVTGEVLYPGIYSIVEGRDRLSDLIERAGGLAPAADLSRAKLRRKAAFDYESGADRQVELLQQFEPNQMSWEEYAFLVSQSLELADQVSVDFEALLTESEESADHYLLDGDVIEIPRALSVVRVSGAVRRPGLVKFEPKVSAGDYIGMAGGYTSDAQRSGTRIVKSQSGSRLRPSRRVKIEPGDIVWVPRKKDRDWWEITKEVLGAVGQVATIYILIKGINE